MSERWGDSSHDRQELDRWLTREPPETPRDRMREDFLAKLETVYAELQVEYGVGSGNITPGELFALEAAQDVLAQVVVDWLMVDIEVDD